MDAPQPSYHGKNAAAQMSEQRLKHAATCQKISKAFQRSSDRSMIAQETYHCSGRLEALSEGIPHMERQDVQL